MISIEIDDAQVRALLVRLRDRVGEAGMRPALKEIGERLTESTKQRFETSTAPDGSRWAPNAESTLLAVMRHATGGGRGGMLGQRGATRAPAIKALAGKRPLVDTKELANGIHHQLIPGGVVVGTDRMWGNGDTVGAAVHQFGSKNGRIPARPFLGLSDGDRSTILAIIERHLTTDL